MTSSGTSPSRSISSTSPGDYQWIGKRPGSGRFRSLRTQNNSYALYCPFSDGTIPDQTEASSTHFLTKAVVWFSQLGIATRRILTDNGPCYKVRRFAHGCRQLGFSHRRTRPCTPRTNGKAERYIKTAINEWAYAQSFQNSAERSASLPLWTHRYNWHRHTPA